MVNWPSTSSVLAANRFCKLANFEEMPVRRVKPIVRKAKRSLSDWYIGPPLVVLIAILVATSGLYTWYEHSPQSEQATQVMPAPAEQVRPNFALLHIQPGKPMQNGYVESFSGRLRDE